MELVGQVEERIQSAHRWDHSVVLTTDEAQALTNAMVERDRLRKAAEAALGRLRCGHESCVDQAALALSDALDGGEPR